MGSIVNPNNYPAKENVLTIIMVSLTWIVFGIFIPDEYLFYSIEIFILALILTSYFYKNILDIIILSFILIVLAISYYSIYPDELYQRLFLFRTAAFSAFIMMGFVLSIGPLSRISDTFLDLYKYRRHLGVSVFFLGALHASQVISFYDEIDINNLINAGDFAALGVITLFGLSFLAFTSWDYIQKRIHPIFFDIIHILWTVGVTYVIYLDFQEYGGWTNIEPYSKQLLYPILIIFAILTFRFSLAKILLKSIMPWKQLHILSWIIFLTMGLHGVTAYDSMVGDNISLYIWTIIAIVFALHFSIWIYTISRNRYLKRDNSMDLDGKSYTLIGSIHDLEEKIGQRFDINGISIAIFKIDGKITAYSNTCAHQKGPICKAKIKNGYLYCPWHQFQYGINDGKGPSGFRDKIPYYHTIIRDEEVWVTLD